MSASAHPHANPLAPVNPLASVGPLVAPRVRGAASAMVVLGFIGFAALLATDANRAWHAWLIGLVIPAFLSIAATAFLAVHRLCNARWTAPLKRLAEGLGSGFPLSLFAFIIFAVFGLPYVYEWAATHTLAEQLALLHSPAKAAWLSPQRVIISTTVILMVWIALRMKLISLSLAEDSGSDNRSAQVHWSVAFLLVMAYTFTLFAWDLLLSLNVHMVSTMWGVYEFVGAVQGFLAVLAIVLVWMSRGQLSGVVREHTIKDVGTWLLAWSCVWAYITFAQYIIIAFANMDEETTWFLMRQQNGYQYPFFVECLLRLPVPFFLLLSQHTRTKPGWLTAAAAAVVLGFFMELIWQVVPALFPNHLPNFGALPELAVALGFLGGYLLLALHFWQRHGTIARGDRDLIPAINAEHLH